MNIYYIRHGDPVYNPDSLTDFGLKQAELLKSKFKDIDLDEIYTSTSNRAILTAEPTAKMKGIQPQRLAWANESAIWKNFAVQDGDAKKWCFSVDKYRELFVKPEIVALGSKWYNHPAFARTPFRDAMMDFENNQDEFMANLGFVHDREKQLFKQTKTNDNKNIAIFAHGGCGMLFLSSLFDMSFPYFSMHVSGHMTTGITIIQFEKVGAYYLPKLSVYNETPHLFKENVKNEYEI